MTNLSSMGKNCLVLLSLMIALVSVSGSSMYRIAPEGSSARSWFRQAAIAADSDVCAQVAREIMAKNGSVVDAGIAAQLCNGVVDQPHMGIGGGSISAIYATPRNGTKKEMVFISGDDSAPSWVTKDSFSGVKTWSTPYKIITEEGKDPIVYTYGELCVGVPGELAGYYRAWERYGKLTWQEVVQPSINLAKYGFPVTKAVEHSSFEYAVSIKGRKSLHSFFTTSRGVLYSKGDNITDPVLAKTLETIAAEPMSFYKGNLAEDIISDIQEHGGKLVKEDLMNYNPRETTPLKFSMMDGKYTAYVPGNPYGGQLFVLAYNIMEGYNMSSKDVSTPEGLVLFYHRFIEAWKFTYSHTGCIGDSEESSEKCLTFLPKLTTTEYAGFVRSCIKDSYIQDDPDMYQLMEHDGHIDLHGTSHLSIIGEDGSAFISTSSINTEFGWRQKGTKTGIIFNNRLNDFTRVFNKNQKHPKDDVNYLGPNKAARSFRMPLLILDQNHMPVIAMGSSGGSRIMMTILQDLFLHIKFDLGLKDAIDYPRIVIQAGNIHYDNMGKEVLDGLKAKGHSEMRPFFPSMPYTAVTQGVSLLACLNCKESGNNCEDPCIEAVSDYRKGGAPAGY